MFYVSLSKITFRASKHKLSLEFSMIVLPLIAAQEDMKHGQAQRKSFGTSLILMIIIVYHLC